MENKVKKYNKSLKNSYIKIKKKNQNKLVINLCIKNPIIKNIIPSE